MELKDEVKEAFCQAYLANGYNASLAYKMTHPDVKDASARSNAHKWMKEKEIKDRIHELLEELYENYNISANTIAAELASVAYQKLSVRGNDYNESTKLKALELLQKQLGLQTQNNNLKIETVIFEDGEKLED